MVTNQFPQSQVFRCSLRHSGLEIWEARIPGLKREDIRLQDLHVLVLCIVLTSNTNGSNSHTNMSNSNASISKHIRRVLSEEVGLQKLAERDRNIYIYIYIYMYMYLFIPRLYAQAKHRLRLEKTD